MRKISFGIFLYVTMNQVPCMSKYVKVCQSMSKYVKVCQSMSKYVKVCQSMSSLSSVRSFVLCRRFGVVLPQENLKKWCNFPEY